MQSVLTEIAKLRNGDPLRIDYRNSNRYRLLAQESDGSKTAYYFSTPIYNQKTGKMIDFAFRAKDNCVYATGSNTEIMVSDALYIANADGTCVIDLGQKAVFVSPREVRCGTVVLSPTANGVALKGEIKGNQEMTFVVNTERPFFSVRANGKYVAFMKERFKPFAVFSCIGSMDATGNVIAPAKIECKKLASRRYRIRVSSTSPLAKYVFLEANLYENKLFQDTTVESIHPSKNNVFGSMGFLGNSAAYGEQWLYSRPDFSKMPEMMYKRIRKAVLHMPKFNRGNIEFSAYKVAARFCSFGSNWNNKIAGSVPISDSTSQSGYQSVDLTSLLVNSRTQKFMRSEGFILKPQIKGQGFSAVTTADSYFAPQILEINYQL